MLFGVSVKLSGVSVLYLPVLQLGLGIKLNQLIVCLRRNLTIFNVIWQWLYFSIAIEGI